MCAPLQKPSPPLGERFRATWPRRRTLTLDPPITRYLLNRLGQSALLLLGVSVIGFALMHLAPGGPLAVYTLNPTVTAQDIERVKHQFGLDQPVYVQYAKWAWGLLTGHWGYSFFGGRPVGIIVLERIPATLELMGSSLVLALVIGVATGILAAVRRNSVIDYATATAAMVALSLPTFWFGLLGIYIFAQVLGWLPAGGIASTRRRRARSTGSGTSSCRCWCWRSCWWRSGAATPDPR